MRATFQLVAANGIIGGGNFWLYVWVTEPERLKGAKDKDKLARRAQRWPEGALARNQSPEGLLNF